jgi:protein-disulfide isomerase
MKLRSRVKTFSKFAVCLLLGFCVSLAAHAQGTAPAAAPASASSPLQKNIEAYLRNVYAFGSDVQVTVGAPKDSAVPGLLETDINVKIGDNNESAKFYVSKDGKYLFRGDLSDMSRDPLADTRAKLQIKDAPTFGDAKAPVTIVEFSDFECPVCRNLHDVVRGLLPKYAGQVRLIFKDFPLDEIHPWARTAALAGRCAYKQSPQSFWKLYDLIYDHQDVISAENAYQKMLDYGSQAGLNTDEMKTCMAGPEAGPAIDASRANGLLVEVSSTPTVFVNGRRMVGADGRTLEQYIQYELAKLKSGKPNDAK